MVGYTSLAILPIVQARLIGNAVLFAFTMLVVVLRMVARLITGSRLGWDDYLMLFALPQGLGLLICQGLWSGSGAGYYVSNRTAADNFVFNATVLLPYQILFSTCIVTIKLSVLFFYLRIFTVSTSRAMRRATQAMLAFVVICGIANLLQSLLVCRVYDSAFHVIKHPFCPDDVASFVTTGIFNCSTNVLINLLPLYTIWTLKTLSVSTRWGLTGVFLLSLNVTWVSIVRIVNLIYETDTTEPLISTGIASFLATLEVNLGILCNSLPMLLPLYSYWRYRKFYGEGEDEYVSRVRGAGMGSEPRTQRKHRSLIGDFTNGLPLETIYGKNSVHFSTTVVRAEGGGGEGGGGGGGGEAHPPTMHRRETGGSDRTEEDDLSDTESTRGLRGPGVITIETKWTITEDTRSQLGLD